MDFPHILLRIIVLVVSVPFGLISAVIPAYAAGRIIEAIGLPAAIGQYLVGGIVLIAFCGYFQDKISHRRATT